MLEHANSCLVYERPIGNGLAWLDLVRWWKEHEGIADLAEARTSLGRRLLASLGEGPEQEFFKAYFRNFAERLGDSLPALIPQVYLHYDPEIASRLGVPAVDALSGEFDVAKTPEGAALAGRIAARLQRDCVASLERFVEEIDESFEIRFARGLAQEAAGAEIEIGPDSPEPLDGDAIDLGEILVHQLSLAMAPFPRKPGARPLAEEFGGETRISPFSGLDRAFAKRREPD